MVVDKGYKQTEVGVIPEDWDALPISEIAVITTGRSDTQDRIDDGEFPFFVRSQNVERINKYTMECEAILTSGDGVGVGKIFHYIHGKFDFHQRVYCIYNFNQSVLGKYLYYQFSTNFFNRVMQLTAKSSVDSVRREMIADMKLPFPKTTIEQTAIANALSDMDALIAQTEKLIEKKKAIKQGVMQELLKPKEGWVTKKLGDVCEIIMGQSPLSEYYNFAGIGLPLIQGNADIKNRKTIIRTYSSNITKKGKLGDIIMTVRAPVGEIALSTFECCLGRGVCALRYENDFMYHYLISIENYWSRLSSGSTFDSVNSNQIKDLPVTLPQIKNEQIEIAITLTDLDKDIELIVTKLQKLKYKKQGMMQALLTGKIRLIC